MFERFVKQTAAVERCRTTPYVKERQKFLIHLSEEGRSHWRLKMINGLLLAIASRVDISDGRLVTPQEVASAAESWSEQVTKPGTQEKYIHSRKVQFIFIATKWLRFVGRLSDPEKRDPFAQVLKPFLLHLEQDHGLAPATIRGAHRSAAMILKWLAERQHTLAQIQPKHISEHIGWCSARGWKRTTISIHVQCLRSFFRYAGSQDWCVADIARTIESPKLYSLERLPQGLTWRDVQRLLAGVEGDEPAQIRNAALLRLLAVYGFRIGEVQQLRLEDLDWDKERLLIRRSKQRKCQEYPLTQEVGEALLRYIRYVRPACRHREVFVTITQPYRPLTRIGLADIVRIRIKNLGRKLTHYGPHMLRHASATRLLAEGFSLKEIGDYLGHVSNAATSVYAKVDLSSLRKVADLDVTDLVHILRQCESHTVVMPQGSIEGLQTVAELSLGGVL